MSAGLPSATKPTPASDKKENRQVVYSAVNKPFVLLKISLGDDTEPENVQEMVAYLTANVAGVASLISMPRKAITRFL
jgi:hypothetical protein